jgi:hypothetical protein
MALGTARASGPLPECPSLHFAYPVPEDRL